MSNYIRVENRKIYPDSIIISVVNFKKISKIDIYEIREKFKEAFRCLRKNYCWRDCKINLNQNFILAEYDKVFLLSDKAAETALYDSIDEFLYLYSPDKIQQRYHELYQHMMNISKEELEREICYYKKRDFAVAHFVEITESIHMIEQMKINLKLLDNELIVRNVKTGLILAYYFKRHNIWKTSANIDQKTVQDYLDGKILESQVHRIVCKFHFWIENVVIRKYMHQIFRIVYYVLYSRVWGFEDSQKFGETFSEDMLSELQQDLKNAKIDIN